MSPDEFPAVFAEGWALPKPQLFLEYFLPLLAPDATFIQPGYPDAQGLAEVERLFRRLFVLIPDLVARPHRSAINDETVFIESACEGTLGRKPIHFSVCDRFVIRDGKIIERQSYTDPIVLIRAVASRPSSWLHAVRARR